MSTPETSVNRRRALAGLGTAAAVGLSGCLGYTIEAEEDVEQRKERIETLETEVDDLEGQVQERESEVDDLNGQIEQKESEISDLESDVADRDEEISTLESDVETLRAEKVASLYALGHARIEAANHSIEQANSASDDEDWRLAAMYWTRAEGEVNGAHASFEDARIVAEEEGFSSVAATIEEARTWADHFGDVCLEFANASLYLSRGDDSTAQDHLDAGEQALDEAEKYDVADVSEIESALGL